MTPDLIAGRYRVVRPIGRGGMGTVWLCRDEVLGREVAVKQTGSLPGESASDAARALREARSSAALNHRNVVSVFDIVDGEHDQVWLVMEYVPSRTLWQVIREDGPLPPRRAAAIVAQIADGLAAAHAVGTIHRDVKPGNILVSEDDVAKISDFGIARGAGDEQLTRTGLVTGTPSYFSPELARGADPAPPSDVYALGGTLYAAVEGHAPYPEQRNAIAMLQQIASEPPPPPENAGELATAISRMMDRDPGTRWTMADAAQALRRLAEGPREQGTAPLGGAAAAGAAAGAGAAGAASGTAADEGEASAAPAGQAAARRDGAAAGSTDGGTAERGRGRGRRSLPLLLAAVVLLALLGGGYMLLADDTSEQPEAGAGDPTPEQTPSRTQSSSSTPSSSPTPSPTPSESSEPSPQPSERETPQQSRPEALEQTVQTYFAAMPGDTDTGWQLLAPSMRAQGRGAYENFWDGIESVQLHSARATGPNQVDIELTYRLEDGSAKRERQRLTLQQQGGDYRIADDAVLSSRSVS